VGRGQAGGEERKLSKTAPQLSCHGHLPGLKRLRNTLLEQRERISLIPPGGRRKATHRRGERGDPMEGGGALHLNPPVTREVRVRQLGHA